MMQEFHVADGGKKTTAPVCVAKKMGGENEFSSHRLWPDHVRTNGLFFLSRFLGRRFLGSSRFFGCRFFGREFFGWGFFSRHEESPLSSAAAEVEKWNDQSA
jgi:hypothetical protein